MIVVTAFALLLGIYSSWPAHIASFVVNQDVFQNPSNVHRNEGAVLTLNFYRRWGRSYVEVVPDEGLGEAEKAELVWLEEGKQFRVDLGVRGRLASGQIAVTTSWPLVFGVVRHFPNGVDICGQTVSDRGLLGPFSGITIDRTCDPQVEEKINQISRRFLEDLRRYHRKRP